MMLHQDHVGGLKISSGNKWLSVPARQDAFGINICDTFMAFCNRRYKSGCIHRAVMDEERKRKSLVYFVSPKEDAVVRSPEDLVVQSSRDGLFS
ncbi:hypothetical protein F3Y22_tig00110890pilonHSYRG00055 [Hibiscus syriacus]|uniref:Isopenicillin N synthase-like Fe(2+) 2OG dioxygenase domain-containing protein n=1 Tax=Hibiscus syriacus TaxID=106335 RepID=A0A6A2ZGV0_HIBSY|nr:hypothetical protein F3Y22_tig00110890pilonHSYRG00055 [Hibiscus syriacus]